MFYCLPGSGRALVWKKPVECPGDDGGRDSAPIGVPVLAQLSLGDGSQEGILVRRCECVASCMGRGKRKGRKMSVCHDELQVGPWV